MAPGVVGVFHDDGIYVATAKALAEGRGYRLIDLPGEPPQTKYPFLYPAVLAILWRLWPVFPDNLVLLQGFSLICTASSVAIAFLYLVRFGYFSSRRGSLGLADQRDLTGAVVLRDPDVIGTAFRPAPDLRPLVRRNLHCIAPPSMSRSTALLSGVTLALSFLTRVVAAPVVAVASLLVLWRKRNVWLLVGAVGCASLWVWWVVRHSVAPFLTETSPPTTR